MLMKKGVSMCTAISFLSNDHYFGRTLDLEYVYDEHIVITPRLFPFHYRELPTDQNHYAIIGIATVMDGYPLYYDACNEHGLCIAGLNFVGNAVYHPWEEGMCNLTQFELIPWLLGRCQTVAEARAELEHINLLDVSFRQGLPIAKLHWMIADQSSSIVVEPTSRGLSIYDNPIGVLTNNPPFPNQLEHLSLYQNLTPQEESSPRFASTFPLTPDTRGTGAMGLPGDWSSPSRFVRASFAKMNAMSKKSEEDSVNQVFHVLGSVEQIEGCLRLGNAMERTQYTSCCNANRAIYYCKTYGNHRITAVSLLQADIDSCDLQGYPLVTMECFHCPQRRF